MSRTVELPRDYPPPGMEVRLLQRFVDFAGKRVLEIGSGDGRLTLQYASQAARVLAVEPDRASVSLARRAAAKELPHVTFRVGAAERVRLGGSGFDIALFSWSL
jgi:2-polyprenyl-3-methyl-5-hydroxy-6-metoxy-1,4-benzoquinol methylase